MTNKEAIDILEKEREEYIIKGCKLDKALDVAISALKQTENKMYGKWIAAEVCDGGVRYQYNQCGDEIIIFDETPEKNGFSFCSNCGAEMKKGGENK